MANIDGTYRHANRPTVHFEAKLDGDECWLCTAKIAGEFFHERTWSPSPWPTIERLVASALDSASKPAAEPPKWDMNRRFKKPTPVRRRLPTGLPEWRPPEN